MPPDDQENTGSDNGGNVIESTLGKVLETRDKSLYWLQQQTGIAYTTLFRLRHNQASSVSFEVMDKICRALECQPGDLFTHAEVEHGRPSAKAKATSKKAGSAKRLTHRVAAIAGATG